MNMYYLSKLSKHYCWVLKKNHHWFKTKSSKSSWSIVDIAVFVFSNLSNWSRTRSFQRGIGHASRFSFFFIHLKTISYLINLSYIYQNKIQVKRGNHTFPAIFWRGINRDFYKPIDMFALRAIFTMLLK